MVRDRRTPALRNVNSLLALETGELVRARAGEAASAAFHHTISRAFFVDGADIADITIVARYAADAAVTEAEIFAARASRAFAHAIDASMQAASVAGVTGVPAFGWAGSHAMSGMMEPKRAIAMLLR